MKKTILHQYYTVQHSENKKTATASQPELPKNQHPTSITEPESSKFQCPNLPPFEIPEFQVIPFPNFPPFNVLASWNHSYLNFPRMNELESRRIHYPIAQKISEPFFFRMKEPESQGNRCLTFSQTGVTIPYPNHAVNLAPQRYPFQDFFAKYIPPQALKQPSKKVLNSSRSPAHPPKAMNPDSITKGIEIIHCPECGASYDRENLLTVEDRCCDTSLDIIVYNCTRCQKKFTNHTGIKLYDCKACKKRFKNRHAFQAHLQTKTCVEKPVPRKQGTWRREIACTECGKILSCKKSLKKHQLHLHTEERNFACVRCDQHFKQKIHLSRHFHRAHLNIRIPGTKKHESVKEAVLNLMKTNEIAAEADGG